MFSRTIIMSRPSAFRSGDCTREDADRAEVDVLIELPADRNQQAPQGDVVGDVRSPHRTEQDGVAVGELGDPVRRHHPAVLPVMVRSPVPLAPIDHKVPVGGDRLDTGHGGRHDLLADAVAGDDVNLVAFTGVSLAAAANRWAATRSNVPLRPQSVFVEHVVVVGRFAPAVLDSDAFDSRRRTRAVSTSATRPPSPP